MASSLNCRRCHRDRSLDRFSSHCTHREFSQSSTIMISKYTVTPTICRFTSICLAQDMNMLMLRLQLTRCIEEIWTSSNRLCLNVSKTEFLWLGSPRRLDGNTGSTQITNSFIAPSKTVRCLGVVIVPAMTFQEHVAGLAGVCYYHLRQLRSVRRSLSVDSCHAVVRALILSRIRLS